MSPIYRPGWESKTYRQYPREVRAAIAANVDKLFRYFSVYFVAHSMPSQVSIFVGTILIR
jgi:hypothetical protein